MNIKHLHIFSVKDFEKIRNLKNYDELLLIINKDIDMNGISNFRPLDFSDKSVHIDGCNNTISNLSINRSNDMEVGFISKAKNLYINNINFENVNIKSGEVSGSIVGRVDETLKLNNVCVNSNIKCDSITGGICGIAKDVKVQNSNIDCSIEGRGVLGGICGLSDTFDIDSTSKVNSSINAEYSSFTKDAAVGEYVGYLVSERSKNITKYLREECSKLPIEIKDEEMKKLNLITKKHY